MTKYLMMAMVQLMQIIKIEARELNNRHRELNRERTVRKSIGNLTELDRT